MPRKTTSDTKYYFDDEAADRAVDFFERYLVHVKAEWSGQPFELLDWQRDELIRPLFGWKRPDGTRKYRTALCGIPRKNGKTTVAAGIGLYLLLADDEPGAEVYSAAADREQARICFDIARAMVESSPVLSSKTKLYYNSIVVPATGSVYKVISADAFTKHGFNAHGIVFDELHAQKTRELWDVLNTSTGARRQPLVVAITTAGVDRESICYEQWDYARQVESGAIEDDSFFSLLYEAGEDDDITDPEVWEKANPSLGDAVKLDYLEKECKKAESTPSYQNTFKRLHLNIWTQQVTRWIDMQRWDAVSEDTFDEEDLTGKLCFGGLDLSAVSDFTAWVLLFPDAIDPEIVRVLPRFWVPKARLYDMRNRYRNQYQTWARQGFLTVTPGDVIDYAIIKKKVLEDAEKFYLASANADRLFQGYQLIIELQQAGLSVFPMGQGYMSMAVPTRELERRYTSGKILHGGNPVLRWMADNVAVREDSAGNKKPDKAGSQGKIDGIVALIMALDRAMHPVEEEEEDWPEGALVNF